jgi:uncharacterized protein
VNQRRKKWGSNKTAVLATVLVLVWVGLTAWADERPKDHLITVIGEAEVKVVPDQVLFTLGIQSWDKDINLAKKSNEDRMNKIVALAKQYGIDPKYIQTDFIQISPRYKHEHEKEIFLGTL